MPTRSTGSAPSPRRSWRCASCGCATRGGSTSTTTQISEQQRTQVRETLSRDRTTIARENQNLNIQVIVGVTLPGHVHVRSLPSDIVRIAPQYRGYEYTVVEDEIVWMRPGSTMSLCEMADRRSYDWDQDADADERMRRDAIRALLAKERAS